MATKKLQKITEQKITEAYVDGDTLDKFAELGKKVGIVTMNDFVKFGELFKGEKNISMTDALKKYCKAKGIKTDDESDGLDESKTPLKEEETFLSAEDMMDAYWVFTTYLEQSGYSNKDRRATIADELSKPKYADKKAKALETYRSAVAAAAGNVDKIAKAKEKYLEAIKEITTKAADAVHWIGYWDAVVKDDTCSVAVHAFDKAGLQPAINLAAEVDMYTSEIYETRATLGRTEGTIYSVDFDPETVDTQTKEWIDFVQAHVPAGQAKAYGTKRFDKARAEVAAADAAGETIPAHHEQSRYETQQIRKRFNKFKADKEARGETVTNQDYFDDRNNSVSLDDTFSDLAGEAAISNDYPEDDFDWGDDEDKKD